MQYNALEPLQNTASEQSQAIEGNPIAVIPKGAPGSQQSGQRFRDQPEKIQFASRAGDQQTQLVPRQRYSPDTYDETRQTSSNEKNYGVHRQSREPDTPKLDGTRFEFSPVERNDSQYKSDQTPSIQTKRQDVSTLSVENRQFQVRPPSNVQSDQQLWSSNLYTPNGFSSSNSLGEDQVGRQEYSLGLKQNPSFSDQQTLPLKFSERSLPMLNHINEPLGEQWFSPYGTQPAPKFDYHGGVERVQQSPLFGIQQVPSSRTLQPAQYGEQEKLSIGFQDISRTGELPTVGELKEPHIVIPQQYKAQKTPSSLDVTLSQYPPIYEQGSLDGINTPQFKSQLPPSLEFPTGSHALESIPIIELEESPFRGLQPQYIGRTMQLSQAAPRSQSTPFNIQPLLGQRAPRYEEPKGPPFRLHMSDHDPPTLDGRQEITFEEPQLQLHTERQVPLQSGTRSQATQVQASLGQRAPSLQLRNGLRDHELSFRVQQQQYPSQYVPLLQTVPLSQNNEETPFGETRDYTFQGPPRTLETNLLKQSQQSPFRGQQVPLYGQQQETPFELQGSPRKLEIMPLKTMQHPQFDALRESFEKNLLRDKQMVNSQQRSYDEPEPISKLAPSIEESNRMPFWRRPDTMFNVQPSSHTEATQRSDLPFSTPVEQMREQQVNWLGQLRNPWSGQDQHEFFLSSAQGELPIRQIPFESDAPSSLQSKVTPEFLMGKSRGFSPGVTRDMQMGVRLIHPEGLTTEFRDEPPTRSLLPYLSLIDKSHQPLTKSVVVIQPIERPLGTLGNLSRRPELLHSSTHSDDFEEDQVLLSQRFPSRQFIQLQEPDQHAHNFEEKQIGNMQMEQPSNGRPRQLVLPSEYQQRTQRILQTDQQTTSTLEHDLDRPWTVVDDQQRSMRMSMTQEFSKELDPRQQMKQLKSSVEPELEVEHRKQTYDGARALTQVCG
ncbi:hypothetical protein GE061_000639 [Apolygus lucorum]|uniref:Uncharacterized protein n=1 Tax=Apolygus lucorum TaxID=248454 RepID=A0A8S9Y6E8_APOLU|nr:hypothetical protein GE061_000639 [Apolygus lucorum]